MPYTVYRSDDIGAPATIELNDPNLRNKIVAILDACLVNGYGSKSSAGWTKPYPDSGGFTLYKSSINQCVRVENQTGSGTGSNPYRASIVIYETDTGSVDFTSRVSIGGGTLVYSGPNIGVGGEYITQTATYNWIVYASSTSFAILLSQNIINGSGNSYLLWSGRTDNTENNTIGIGQIGGTGMASGGYVTLSPWTTIDTNTSSQHNYKLPSSLYRSAYLQLGTLSSTGRPSNPRSGLAGQGSSILTENIVRYAPIRMLDRNTGFYVGEAEGIITLEHAGSTFLNMNDTITINSKQYIVCRFLPVAVGNSNITLSAANQGFVLFEI